MAGGRKSPETIETTYCKICDEIPGEPYLTSCCGYHFCEPCLQSRFATGGSTPSQWQVQSQPCPLCSEQPFFLFLDKFMQRRTNERVVSCERRSEGCRWEGKLRHRASHQAACGYVVLACPNGCGTTVRRQELSKHLDADCPKRPFSCGHCDLRATYEEIVARHWDECADFPLQCPNACGAAAIQRSRLEQHRDECPTEEVPCELAGVGCKVRPRRRDLEAHMERETQAHLRLLVAHTLRAEAERRKEREERERQSQLKIERQRKEIEKLREALRELARKLDESLEEKEQEIENIRVVHCRELKTLRESMAADNHNQVEPPEQEHIEPENQREAVVVEPPQVELLPGNDNNDDNHHHRQPDQEGREEALEASVGEDKEDRRQHFAATGEGLRRESSGGTRAATAAAAAAAAAAHHGEARAVAEEFMLKIRPDQTTSMSPPFSTREGHMLRLDVYHRSGTSAAQRNKTRDVSVNVYVLRGDRDDKLKWPLQARIMLEAVDTNGRLAVGELEGCWSQVKAKLPPFAQGDRQCLPSFIKEDDLPRYLRDGVLNLRITNIDIQG